jgi:hypothetical protein
MYYDRNETGTLRVVHYYKCTSYTCVQHPATRACVNGTPPATKAHTRRPGGPTQGSSTARIPPLPAVAANQHTV